jgi:2,7-dihydroxy-5-methyl-1-naphthoate 7-O-methyltransferase
MNDVLAQQGEHYSLTPLSEAMREGRGENRGPLTLDVRSAVGRVQLAAVGLLDSVRTGVPAYQMVHGRGFWDDLAADAALRAGFDAFMGAGDQSAFAAAYDWSAVEHVVDVGGGTGARLIALLRAHASLRGTLVELPGPAERAAGRFAEVGLDERVTVVARSFFEPLPVGADVYVLSAILHDWPDPEATAILRRSAEAAGPSGRVLVVEQVLDNADDMAGMTAFDLFMLICCGGRERTLDEFRTLGSAAGLSLRSVLEGPILEFARLRG